MLDGFPREVRKRLLETRALIYELSQSLDAGPLTETLKWGEPAYLTEASKSGSTIRLGWKAAEPGRCQLYFNCNTDLVDRFRAQFPEALHLQGQSLPLVRSGGAGPGGAAQGLFGHGADVP